VSSGWVCLGYCGAFDLPVDVDQVVDFNGFMVVKVHGGGSRFLILGEAGEFSADSISLTLPPQLVRGKLSPASGRGESICTGEDNTHGREESTCEGRESLDGAFVDENEWRLLDIRAGIANIYPETSELFTPNMLRLAELKGLSFDKGCYVGQEIIARTQYLGKVKRTLQHFQLQSDQKPQAGDALHNSQNQPVGIVVDASIVTPQCYELLAVVQDAQDEAIFWNGHKLAAISLEFASS
jgi:folate-binding protein YgfZ